jgi:hypothetical protein
MPQIKQDLNRSGWETTDFPSVCEKCLPDNPYVQMLKEDHGAECKICTRPFTIFRWKADRTSRQKRTNICLTCARLKNCCQCCMLDLSFGLPIVVRDAALKMVAPGPKSDINRQYYAQEHEREIEEGRGAMEAYEKTDEKARELLKRLAQSEPYHKKQRRMEADEGESGQKALPAPGGSGGGGADEAAQDQEEVDAWVVQPLNQVRKTGYHHRIRTSHLSSSPASRTTCPSTSSARTLHNTASFDRWSVHIEHIAHTSTTSSGRMRRPLQRL